MAMTWIKKDGIWVRGQAVTNSTATDVESKPVTKADIERWSLLIYRLKLTRVLINEIRKRTGGCMVYPSEGYPGHYWIVPGRKVGETDEKLALRSALIDMTVLEPGSFGVLTTRPGENIKRIGG